LFTRPNPGTGRITRERVDEEVLDYWVTSSKSASAKTLYHEFTANSITLRPLHRPQYKIVLAFSWRT
jgi:hypothetical protein